MKVKANYLGIVVEDLAAATAFYRDQLGWSVDEQESIPGAFVQFHGNGETTVALQTEREVPAGQTFAPALLVEDVDATYAAWQAKGVELLDEPHDRPFGRTFLFRAPTGHVWRVYAYHCG